MAGALLLFHNRTIIDYDRRNKKWIKNAALVLTVCIILSTMFLKQHSVFDVLTAFALAAFMYSVCYGSIAVAFERRRQKRIPAGQI